MKVTRIIPTLIVILLLSSCATQKLIEDGNTAYDDGNYESALNSLEQVIEKRESAGRKAEGEVYYKAGKAAMKLGQSDKARTYLESAEETEYASPGLYASLAKIYKNIDNLSKEIEALETYNKKYPEGEQIDTINARLFETYVESENWNKGKELWPEIENQAESDLSLLAGYLTINKELENDALSDKLAEKILDKDPENPTALEYYAFKYFWKAENLYVSQMKAYQKNRTNKQYKKLMEAWDKIWPDYRKSRDYFKKLYYIKPNPKYAKFLGNIYKRMDQDDKAAFWYKRAK